MNELTGFRVAVLATDGFEETELTEPVKALKQAGAHITIVAPKAGKIQGFKHDIRGKKVTVDKTIAEVSADDFDGVHLPGGTMNADTMRIIPEVQAFLKAMQEDGKPIGAICHAPWELISAGLVSGRRLTGYKTIEDDVKNAGGDWVDQAVAQDNNWVTSRQPDDLPAFNKSLVELFAQSAMAHRG
jgi:protease I